LTSIGSCRHADHEVGGALETLSGDVHDVVDRHHLERAGTDLEQSRHQSREGNTQILRSQLDVNQISRQDKAEQDSEDSHQIDDEPSRFEPPGFQIVTGSAVAK
jgi:hypothetical protein